MSLRSAIPISFFRCSSRGVTESRHPSFDANPFQTKRSPSSTALFETPFQNFFVRPALLHTLNQIAMVHAQKIAAHPVRRFERAEVSSIILVQFAAGVQPNLVQHTREIHHAARHFFGTLWIGSHTQMNRIICGVAILASLLAENHSEKAQVIQTR
jgi:hypothetical protein